ncbi:BirA family biotin operon repressor/biotin-[acetyl-CoA-carboxylase] ligase [Jatrophihabitans sp. GAS493]|uniref:biotin--[acetyl-CoA-carboxylase] ligase n=1 Tax=Jatrophihabitans sp. GAS493 TaxID=1907575 RepID=UPI000BB81614|nr:biotin--[acetyl-CoA-carboxylase] ligase [Jatrophihabitans sp. GAS493]SOD74781.1 BirA family biotin operon repressor/biotin-[acetyl-CoA-carboxylase] ligase [Jatrophihabitans sp. GAS493]
MSLPERPPLDPDRLHATDAIAAPWHEIRVVAESPSTNTDLITVADSAPSGAVLVAEHQTAGLGRLGRQWESPARSSLTVSVLLRPAVDLARWGWLALLAGVALREAVAELDVAAALKWPNDLLIGPDEQKAAGILAQVSGTAVVIGIGVNVTNTREELPIPAATSLELSGAAKLDRTELLLSLLAKLGTRYLDWEAAGGDAQRSGLADEYRAHCSTLGRAVTVEHAGGGAHEGTATGIDADGRLLLRTKGNDELAIGAGDVHHLRAIGDSL